MQNDKQKPRVAVREDLFTNELEWALGKFTNSLSRARVRARKINFPWGIPQGPNFFFNWFHFSSLSLMKHDTFDDQILETWCRKKICHGMN